MTWNHRVLRYEDGTLGIHEVFYEDGEPTMCTMEAVGAQGDTLEELLEELHRMSGCVTLPILDYEDIGCRE